MRGSRAGALGRFTLLLLVIVTATQCQASAPTIPPNLLWAERLVPELTPAKNVYGSHPTYVVWSEDGKGVARNRSVCSSFVSHDMVRAYGWSHDDFIARFGRLNPQAKDYHDAIVAGRGFTRVLHVTDIEPGDVLAISYGPGSRPTGHVLQADTPARPHAATTPLEPNTTQYEIAVIDSANSGHGLEDTRYEGNGKYTTGVGRGTFRLYAGPSGEIAGYSWSTRSVSVFYSSPARDLVVGRYSTAAFTPAPVGTTGSGSDDGTLPGAEQ